MSVTEIETVQVLEEKIKGDRTAIIHFRSGMSERSSKMQGLFEELCRDHSTIDFFSVNVDGVKGLGGVNQVGEVNETPTFMVFKNGNRSGIVVRPDVRGLRKLVSEAA